jgi:hypothetical protein
MFDSEKKQQIIKECIIDQGGFDAILSTIG